MKTLITVCTMIVLFSADYARATGTWTPINKPGAYATTVYATDGSNLVGTYTNDSSGVVHGFTYDGTDWFNLDAPGANYTWAYGAGGGKVVGE